MEPRGHLGPGEAVGRQLGPLPKMARSFCRWAIQTPSLPGTQVPCDTTIVSFSLPDCPLSLRSLRHSESPSVPHLGLKVIVLGSTRPSHVCWGQGLGLWEQT